MPLYATTLLCHHRRGFDVDRTHINEVINWIHDQGHETGHLGWEIQDEGMQNLHCHFTVYVEKFINLFELHKLAKQCDVHCHIVELKNKKDNYNWNVYIHKRDYDVRYAYAESSRPEPKQNLFSECWKKLKQDTFEGCWKCSDPNCYLNKATISL